MTRDEATSAWYATRTVTQERKASITRWTEHPRFRAPDGTLVRTVSIDGVPGFKVTRHGMFVAMVRDLAELDLYVDVSTLRLDIGQEVKR